MRKSPLYEVVGQLGMWGTLINGIQAAGLEHKVIPEVTWNGAPGELRSDPLMNPGLTASSKSVCCWPTPPRCLSCTRRPRSSID